MYTDSEDIHVTKLVDLVARIPKHLDFHFSDFFYDFLGIFRVCYFEFINIFRLGP